MTDLKAMIEDDFDLLMSVGSSRPRRGGLADMIAGPRSDDELRKQQEEFDAAVAEMKRRDAERGFAFHIPR
jgi:2'-5' RNA ligase